MKYCIALLFSITLICCNTPAKEDEKPCCKKVPEEKNVYSKYASLLQSSAWNGNFMDENESFFHECYFTKINMDAPHYGFTMQFLDSIHFKNSYSAECGNDCFTTIKGKYSFADSVTIRLFVDSIEYRGMCEKPTVYPKKSEQYLITEDSAKTIVLKLK